MSEKSKVHIVRFLHDVFQTKALSVTLGLYRIHGDASLKSLRSVELPAQPISVVYLVTCPLIDQSDVMDPPSCGLNKSHH